MLEFVEMFKAPIKMLHPLLTATQEGNYVGTENIGALPFAGIIMAHSNEAEWQSFRANKNNEAFIDRIYVIKVPYCLRVTEEQKIYEKLIRTSELADGPVCPGDARDAGALLRAVAPAAHENSNLFSKMRVYDGESLREVDPRARSMQEYKDAAGVNEGMDGISTRFAFKVLAATFNHDTVEVAADPVHLMYVLEQALRREQLPADTERRFIEFIKTELARATPSSSATRSRRPISNPTTITGRTCSTATSPMRMPGSRTRTSRIRTPGSSSTGSS